MGLIEVTQRKAVIDIGTNSIKFCLAESDGPGSYRVVKDVTEITRLGEGLKDTGYISPDVLERNARPVANFVNEARSSGADEVVVVGTMAMREAKNTCDFIKRVKDLCGVTPQVLSGEEEGMLSYEAVVAGISGAANADLIAMDTGGGSTEFSFGKAGRLVRSFSLNVGSVRFTEDYLAQTPVPGDRLAAVRAAIKAEFAAGGVTGPADLLVGMGGTVTTMAAVKYGMAKYDPDRVQNSTLTLDDVRSQIADYASKSLAQRREIKGLHPKRADVILAGACILEAVLELTGMKEFIVSDRSLRHGLLHQLFNK